ncbi:unnamed protein product [Hydatigera taeniaeformis]|uniref:PAZ domain-containing protein n=1 Tax=Hydatigena taeniaeformis TaxID=6205 RepID=A0A0R3WWH8_HYDTA|nr:unnamed protein product [Hydatigera taeniaeformis]
MLVSGKPYKRQFVVCGLSRRSAAGEIIADLKKSIEQYFSEKYGIRLKYPELPCVKLLCDCGDDDGGGGGGGGCGGGGGGDG